MLLTFSLLVSAERLTDGLSASVPKMPSESASEGLAPKVTLIFVNEMIHNSAFTCVAMKIFGIFKCFRCDLKAE